MGGSRRRGHEVRSHARGVGYIRVSTEDQILGPDAQRTALERWASARGVELVGVFEDRGVSGAAALDRRPEFGRGRTHGPFLSLKGSA